MLITHTQLQNIPVMSLQTGAQLGQTTTAIIDPRQLKIVAFYCFGANIQGTAILHTSDIRELGNMGIIVDSADNLMNPTEDLVRLQEVINFHFELIGKRVRDTNGNKMGKVQEYSIDDKSFYIVKLNVGRPFFKSFLSAGFLIDRTQIVEVTQQQVTVRGNEVKQKAKAVPAPIVENPFRKQQHVSQQETSRK